MNQFVGPTLHKNSLGALCMLFGAYLVWDSIASRQEKKRKTRKDLYVFATMLVMVFWLFRMADSATSYACFWLIVIILIGIGTKVIRTKPKRLTGFIIILVCTFLFLQFALDITGYTVSSLGRDITLSGRIELWKQLLEAKTHPLLGVGYESFWLGKVARELWLFYWWKPNQAHNGYLEIYLNIGFVGVFLLLGTLARGLKNAIRSLEEDLNFGRIGFAFMIIVPLYNITEAIFLKPDLIWFLFVLFGLRPLSSSLADV
jgi:O-antigen ligase